MYYRLLNINNESWCDKSFMEEDNITDRTHDPFARPPGRPVTVALNENEHLSVWFGEGRKTEKSQHFGMGCVLEYRDLPEAPVVIAMLSTWACHYLFFFSLNKLCRMFEQSLCVLLCKTVNIHRWCSEF